MKKTILLLAAAVMLLSTTVSAEPKNDADDAYGCGYGYRCGSDYCYDGGANAYCGGERRCGCR